MSDRQARWISLGEAAERLEINRGTLERLVRQGHLTTRTLPGGRPRVLAADVDRLEAESITLAVSSQAG
jgi:excisionase family DNA binding protein